MKNRKPRLLLLFPGPRYNLTDTFEDRCARLSSDFDGLIITSGPNASKAKFSDFHIHCAKDPLAKSMISTVKFLFLSLFYVIRAKFKGQPFDLFVTYDPLKTGLIGVVVSFITRTKLAVEVNGVYTDEVIYWDTDKRVNKKFKKWLLIRIERFVLNRASGVKLLFPSQIDYFRPLKRKDVAITAFPDYVRADDFVNLGKEKVILTAGFPFWVKGIDILIEAFKKVSEIYPDWRLKILGYYPDRTLLNQYMAGHPRIEYHPPVDHQVMPDHIGRCGIFVLASRTEAMGRVLVEAMSAGKPRIGANVGGIPTVIRPEVDGLLFQAGDSDSLKDAMIRLIDSSELAERLGNAARERYLDEFRPNTYFSQLKRFYMTVIG